MTYLLGRVATAIRRGELTAHEAAMFALRMAHAVPNAVVHVADGDDIAARIAAVPPGAPFAGVPILMKDTASEAGRPFTFGTRALEGYVARETSAWAAALAAIGFVSVGRTATPEFGLSDTTEPVATGPVANPWGPGLSPGGSSGGAAAIVAAGAVPFAHGSDGGGSLRAPASLCGLVSLKPSRGALMAPLPQVESWMPALGEGFGLSPDVGSSAAVFAALRGEAPTTLPPSRRLRIQAIVTPLHGRAPHAEVASVLDGVADLLRGLGHTVMAAAWPFDAPALHAAFFELWAMRTHLDLQRFPATFGRPLDRTCLEGWTLGLDELGAAMGTSHRSRIDAMLRDATAGLLSMLADCDVLLTPVTGRPRLRHGEHNGDREFAVLHDSLMDNVCYTPIHNIAGTPSLALPLGAGADGRPVGVQIAGKPGDDALLFALGLELEAARPFVRPPVQQV